MDFEKYLKHLDDLNESQTQLVRLALLEAYYDGINEGLTRGEKAFTRSLTDGFRSVETDRANQLPPSNRPPF